MNKQYFNPAQQKVMYTAAHTTVFVGGRRLGKTHGIAAPKTISNIQSMPRGTHAFVSPSLKRCLANTLPGTLKAMNDMGYRKGIHYFVGRKPPKSANFPKPYTEPESWDHIISWYTGAIHHIISQDVQGSSNSLTLDSLTIDEAKFINFEKLKDETLPANGGTKKYFGSNPHHHGIMIMSDMPTSKKGSWFLNYKEKNDPEVIRAIHALVFERWKIRKRISDAQLKGEHYPAYLDGQLNKINRDLSKLRRVAVYYEEFSSIENIELLGEGYIKQMKRDLPPLIFQTSILCKRIGVLKDGFYQSLIPSIHYYLANNNSYLMNLGYNTDTEMLNSSLADGDLNPMDPICIGMDYNSNINWIVAGQPSVEERKLRVIKSFFTKYERKIRECVNDFCHYYRYHINKTLVFYYDSTALGSNYAIDENDYATVIMRTYEQNGWTVVPQYLGNPMRHKDKHLLINMALKGQGELQPVINKENNEELIPALESAGTRNGPTGFSKDKTGEKLAETEEDKLEYRTDGTDAFDTLVIGCATMPYYSSSFMRNSTR